MKNTISIILAGLSAVFLGDFVTLAEADDVAAVNNFGVLVEAESFEDIGGWVVDQQSMDQMGSPYLMAHGLGRPVKDAITSVKFPSSGEYRVWVRTRDSVAPWKTPDTSAAMKAEGTPGRFELLVDGKPLGTIFGIQGAEWHWQDGGTLTIEGQSAKIALHDLTGFNGRCDALLFCQDKSFSPPDDLAKLSDFRQKFGGVSKGITNAGSYDLVVVGGGTAGICAAISAARYGCRVALIQNRPVLGGNNSSEVRVGLSGLIYKEPYPKLGRLIDEIAPVGYWPLWEARRDPDSERSKKILQAIKENPEKKQHNAGPATNYDDQRKLDVVLAEKNITLFLNSHVNGVEMNGKKIAAVIAQNIRSGERLRFKGQLFADCTGDANLGVLAGADFREGREARSTTGESLAPEESDQLVMGTSVQWYSRTNKEPSAFPECPWAVPLTESNCIDATRGDWNWETGSNLNQVKDIEQIRDYALRVTFGNWSVLKNSEKFKEKFALRELEWVAYIGGKRESRRLLGDIILSQQDVQTPVLYPDATVTTTWSLDLHYPKKSASGCDPFQSIAKTPEIKPYPIPYRTLYSRNIDNLMMAGRNISVTHVALGTTRVMRTTGMMGEVLGMASGLCVKHRGLPRDIYKKHLDELKLTLSAGVPSAIE